MTKSQDWLYWNRWNAVVRANDWRFSRGRISDRAVREVSEHHISVWRIAENRALQEHRAVIADDLRHACHIYALGADMSHGKLSNAAFTRLLALWGDGRQKAGLLIDPDCLESRGHWDDHGRDAQDRTDAFIRRFPEAYVRTIAASRFGTRVWELLHADQRADLAKTLSQRKRAKQRPIHRRDAEAQREPEPEPALALDSNEPF